MSGTDDMSGTTQVLRQYQRLGWLRRPEHKDSTVGPPHLEWQPQQPDFVSQRELGLKACRVSISQGGGRCSRTQGCTNRPATGSNRPKWAGIRRARRPSPCNPTTGNHCVSSCAYKLLGFMVSMGRGFFSRQVVRRFRRTGLVLWPAGGSVSS